MSTALLSSVNGTGRNGLKPYCLSPDIPPASLVGFMGWSL
jgi:hypothetical protein